MIQFSVRSTYFTKLKNSRSYRKVTTYMDCDAAYVEPSAAFTFSQRGFELVSNNLCMSMRSLESNSNRVVGC